MSSKSKIVKIHSDLIKEATKFSSYYYRNYFLRKIENQFQKLTNADEINSEKLYKKSEDLLAILKRQTVISNMYGESKLVIEEKKTIT